MLRIFYPLCHFSGSQSKTTYKGREHPDQGHRKGTEYPGTGTGDCTKREGIRSYSHETS